MKIDRFEFEQQIMSCWNVTSDVELLFRSVCDKNMTTDQISNCLLGMKEMYELRFNELFDTFEKLVQQNKL